MTNTKLTLREICEGVWRDRIERETAIYMNLSCAEGHPLREHKLTALAAYKEICWQFALLIPCAVDRVKSVHGDRYSFEQIVNVVCTVARDQHDKVLPLCADQMEKMELIKR